MSTEILRINGGTKDVIELMKEYAAKSALTNSDVQTIATELEKLPINEALECLYQVVYNLYNFVPDSGNWQTIRTSKAFLNDQIGNCVDASVFISSILIYMDIPHSFRFFAQSLDSGYNHVFVVAQKDYILDTILGKPGSGTETWFSPKKDGYFNEVIPEKFNQMDIQII